MIKENEQSLERIADQFSLSHTVTEKFAIFIDLLEEWSKKMNLVSTSDVKKISEKHIADSLQFENFGLVPASGTLLDLGSGAGFPGLVLAILKPGLFVTLLDSQRKRALFLNEAISVLKVPNAKVVCERAEALHLDENERFDVITARAVASLEKLWSWSSELLKPRGVVVAQKGGNLDDEILALNRKFDVDCKIIPIPSGSDKKFVLLSV